MKIYLSRDYEKAQEFANEVKVEATVEAEYGTKFVKGTVVTMAHHVEEYKHMNAPCLQEVPVLDENSSILVSHIDLDTLGGIMRLLGRESIVNNANLDFWKAAEFIDLNGPHRLHEVSEQVDRFNAYYAWNSRLNRVNYEGVTEVTELVMEHIATIEEILNNGTQLLENGKKWSAEIEEKVASSLIEDGNVRVFAGPHFTAASYYSKELGKTASVTVSFFTLNKSITVATSDNSINCKDLMQKLFGPEAGGHAGIAGTPRQQEMTFEDLYTVVNAVKELV